MTSFLALLLTLLAAQVQPEDRGREFTWRDGDQVRRVYLVEEVDGVLAEFEEKSKNATSPAIRQHTRRWFGVVSAARSARLPVFRGPGGTVMTLPGGVLVALEKEATDAAAFFAANGIAAERLKPVEGLDRTWLVETAPGFPSLELANRLAELEDVEVSSPNWLREREVR